MILDIIGLGVVGFLMLKSILLFSEKTPKEKPKQHRVYTPFTREQIQYDYGLRS